VCAAKGLESHVKIYLGNLPKETTDAQLSDLVTPFGKPTSCEVAKDRATGESRGFGFVVFAADDEGNAAITGLNGKDVGGRALKVSEARSKQ